jgi:carbon monoxide dehydrogenase subunit G
MPTFSQRVLSDDRIDTSPGEVWEVLVTPELLARLTPLVDRITVDGDLWHWRLTPVSGLGMTEAPEFTTLMHLEEGRRISFEPAPGADDRASAVGELRVDADGDGTTVAIDITASVDLPLPGLMGRAVRGVMFQTMKAGGSRFARNMLAHLGDPPHRGLHVRSGDT